jgi:uncharacterized protein (DUF488 family)
MNVFCIPTRCRAPKHLVQVLVDQSRVCYDISRYTQPYLSTVKSRSSLVKMLLPAVVSVALLAALGQGQTSKSRAGPSHPVSPFR